jgi:hypothetical protein
MGMISPFGLHALVVTFKVSVVQTSTIGALHDVVVLVAHHNLPQVFYL